MRDANADGAPARAGRPGNSNSERQPQTAPDTKQRVVNRTGSRRHDVPVSDAQRETLARVGFRDYKFRTPEERDRVGALGVEVAERPGRKSWAVVWELKKDGYDAGLAARIEWEALGRGEHVMVTDGRVRQTCPTCGARFLAPLDWPSASCPSCEAPPCELAREVAGSTLSEPCGRETADAERARQQRAFTGAPETRTPTPAPRAPVATVEDTRRREAQARALTDDRDGFMAALNAGTAEAFLERYMEPERSEAAA